MTPDMQPTPESSSVAEIGYDEQAEEVWVTFVQSGTYVYSQVPQVVWDEFCAAASKGAFVNSVLKPGYPYRRA